MLAALAVFGTGELGAFDAEFWVLAALVLVGELFPIQVHGQVGEETFSTPFAFALLLTYGIPEVVVVQVAASLAADLIRRRPVDRIVFNLAQLAISWVAAGLALDLAGGTGLRDGSDLTAGDLPAIALAAVVFFATNTTLPRTAEAMLQKSSISEHLRGDLIFRSWSAGTLFALGPPVAVIAEHWLYLVPLSLSRWPRSTSPRSRRPRWSTSRSTTRSPGCRTGSSSSRRSRAPSAPRTTTRLRRQRCSSST